MQRLKVGKYYRPSILSFEDKDTVLKIDSIRCGRVEYTNIATQSYGSMPIDEFMAYYEETRVKGKK